MPRVDWAATAAGPVSGWSPSLRAVISTMLYARQPMFLWWGPRLVQFYNDGYVPSFGRGRHPAALGQEGRECWAEIWSIIGPEIEHVRQRGEATFHDDALVPIFRNGRMEEVYWTYGYSPVFEADGTVAGVLVIVTETTSRVLALRRLKTIQFLSNALNAARRHDDLVSAASSVLGEAREDAPWSLVFRSGEQGTASPVVATSGIPQESAAEVGALVAGKLATLSVEPLAAIDVSSVPGLPGTPWPEASTRAVAVALYDDESARRHYLVLGLSPRLPYDPPYQEYGRALERQFAATAQRIASQRAKVVAEGARDDLVLKSPVAAALLVGPRWHFELANGAYTRMVGRDVNGRDWHDCFPELVGSPAERTLEHAYRTGEPTFVSEQHVPLLSAASGQPEDRFFDFNLVPIRSVSGSVTAMMVVAIEMTAQVLARRALERAAAERERILGELRAALRTKDEFLAVMGHELRNPLSPIVTALELMRTNSSSDTRRERAIITRQVKHLQRLVDDLLDVSRITQGKIELRRAVADVETIVRHTMETIGELYQARRHEIELRVEPGLTWYGDETRLQQVLINLLTNAARYTDPGGHVQLSIEARDAHLVILIRDNGRGMDAALLERVFEPFLQGERGSDRREGGLGLGLAIVHGLVELHGGSVVARSHGPGRGSEFEVRLPGIVASAPDATETPDEFARRTTPAHHRSRVLITDDNEDAANLLADFLASRGHEVVTAHLGATALELASTFAPSAAVLDIGLPGMDGYELVKELRARAHSPSCRYIALTGYGQREDIERAIAAGFDDVLIKPVDLAALTSLLEGVTASG